MLTRRTWIQIGWTRVIHGLRFQEAGRLRAASGSELGHHDCAPGVTAPTQNPLGARHQAAARWRNEEGHGVGRCEMLWVGDVGDWRGVVCAEGGGEIGEGRRTWALWKWLGSWLSKYKYLN